MHLLRSISNLMSLITSLHEQIRIKLVALNNQIYKNNDAVEMQWMDVRSLV
jgi:hypothetical protein